MCKCVCVFVNLLCNHLTDGPVCVSVCVCVCVCESWREGILCVVCWIVVWFVKVGGREVCV